MKKQKKFSKVEKNIDRGLWIEYGAPEDGYISCVNWNPPDHGDEAYYSISYHKWDMPAFNIETYSTMKQLVVAMRKIEPDLRKWKLTEME